MYIKINNYNVPKKKTPKCFIILTYIESIWINNELTRQCQIRRMKIGYMPCCYVDGYLMRCVGCKKEINQIQPYSNHFSLRLCREIIIYCVIVLTQLEWCNFCLWMARQENFLNFWYSGSVFLFVLCVICFEVEFFTVITENLSFWLD